MLKVKCLRSADCVVGGFRYATGSRQADRCWVSTMRPASSIMLDSHRESQMPTVLCWPKSSKGSVMRELHLRRAGRA